MKEPAGLSPDNLRLFRELLERERQMRAAGMTAEALKAAEELANLENIIRARTLLFSPFETDADAEVKATSDAPHFITCARPQAVPLALRDLDGKARITWESNLAGRGTRTTYRAGEYRQEIEAQIVRQAESYFTLDEAAQVLADARPGVNPIDTVRRFLLAHSKGEIPIHCAESRFPLEIGETIYSFLDLLEVGELDVWLRHSAGYGFPPAPAPAPREAAAVQTVRAGAADAATESPKQRRDRLLMSFEDEEAQRGKRGALARVTALEKLRRPTADRSNISRYIKKAREERKEQRRGGALAQVLTQ